MSYIFSYTVAYMKRNYIGRGRMRGLRNTRALHSADDWKPFVIAETAKQIPMNFIGEFYNTIMLCI